LHVCKKFLLIFALLILDRYMGTKEKPGKCKRSGRSIQRRIWRRGKKSKEKRSKRVLKRRITE